MATVLDTLTTNLNFQPNLSGLRKMETGVNRARAKLDGLASGFFKAGGILTGALAVTGAKVLSFERSWNELTAVFLNESAPALETLRKQALLLGRTTSKSASEAVEAQTALARSGLKLNQVLAATPAVLNLAIAGNLEMGAAAELVASTLNSYGLEADQATRVTDVFASAASNTAFSVGQIGAAFRQAGPLAKALNIPFERTVAALGVLRTGGLLPEMAGTGLRNILAILSDAKPPENVEAGFKSIGLSFQDMSKRLKDSGDIVGIMRTMVTAGLDATSALQIFGRESGTAAILLAKGGAGAQELEETFLGAATTADRMRERMESGLPGAVDKLKSAFEGLLLSLGEAGITGALEKGANMLSEFINRISEGPPQLVKLIASVLLLGPALLGVGAALKAVSIGLGFAMGGLKILSTGWITLRVVALKSLAAMRVAAVASFGAIRAVGLASLLSLQTAWTRVLLTFKSGGVKALFTSGFASISTAGVGAIATIKAFFLSGFTAISAAALTAFTAVKGIVLAALAPLAAVSWPVVAALAAAALVILVAWKPISTFFVGLWNGLTGGVGKVAKAMGRLLDALGPVGEGIRAIGRGIVSVFSGIGDAFSWLMDLLPDLTSEGEGFGEAIINGIVAVIDAITGAINFIRELDLAEAGKALFMTFIDGILSVGGAVKDAVKGVVDGITDLLPFSDAQEGPLSRLTRSGQAIVDTLAQGIRQADPLKLALEPALAGLVPLTAAVEPALAGLGPLTAAVEPVLEELAPLKMALDTGGASLPPLDAIAPPLPIAPLPTPALAGAGAAGSEAGDNKVEMSFGQGAIVINAAGGDAGEIAGHIEQELREKMRAGVEQLDSRIVG